jgi:adenylate cyclase
MSSELMAAVVRTGGVRSPYMAGTAILVVATGLFLPYSARRMAGIAAVMLTIYVVPLAAADIPGQFRDVPVTAFVLLAATLCAIVGTHELDRLRRTELTGALALRAEQAKTERLLLNVLPKPIADRLKEDERSVADAFSDVTILFADIVGFTELSAHTAPDRLVAFLNDVFSAFDELAERLGLEKIKTIGDAYMVAGGVPNVRGDHARAVAEMALGMRDLAAGITRPDGLPLQIRIGLNSGPVVAGVIGRKKFIYDLWGDAVNTASRMESHSVPSSIHVAPATFQLLKDDYRFEARGVIEVKGKGAMETYFLHGRR